MSDSLEETLRKVIEDIDLSGDDEMVFVGTREDGIEGLRRGRHPAFGGLDPQQP